VEGFPVGSGIDQLMSGQPELINPEELGINKNKLNLIDSIAIKGIKERCYPGCQIVGMKEGKIFYRKSFGSFTYSESPFVNNESLYDLASLTKILSSSLAIMDLVSQGKLNLDLKIEDYLPETKGSNKANLVIREMLAHQSGLPAWIAFYKETIDPKGDYKPGIYNTTFSDEFPVRVAENLYMRKDFQDSIFQRILSCKLETKDEYLYSDLGYYFIQRIVKNISGQNIDEYVQNRFYNPMGLKSIGYTPLNRFSKNTIAPTENDLVFRKQLIQGDVHDQGAAMMGGIACHAGLFGNASDVAKIMQLLLNGGEFEGKRFLASHVVEDFTIGCCYCKISRRGLCFDKPEVAPGKKSLQVTESCSKESFGHSGFTGTFAWADPKNDLVFVFLSNRVHPDAEDNRLSRSGIRMKIHQKFYEAINEVAPQIQSERTF
jgi:CubicO group peptidase (beta-lactamase class C family)